MRLPKCDCSRGAPLGRLTVPGPVVGHARCAHLPLDAGGYDAGGAYWGLGQPLYGLADDQGVKAFTRAGSRGEAMRLFTARFGAIRWKRKQPSLPI